MMVCRRRQFPEMEQKPWLHNPPPYRAPLTSFLPENVRARKGTSTLMAGYRSRPAALPTTTP